MTYLSGQERSDYVQQMFGRVADRYNLLNRVMTFGQDMRWRRFVVAKANLPKHGSLLDLATGTGDIAFEAKATHPEATVIGADFALPMMYVGQREARGNTIDWSAADALHLPFPNHTFDAVVSGYLVRNVIDIPRTLQEQARILKAGGRIVILDTSPPPNTPIKPLIQLHLTYGIPFMGRILGGKAAEDAYTYLPESTKTFKTPDELAQLMQEAGFRNVGYQRFMFGTQAIHWGDKAI